MHWHVVVAVMFLMSALNLYFQIQKAILFLLNTAMQIKKLLDLIDDAYRAGQRAGDSFNQPLDALQKSWDDLEAQAAAQIDKTSTYLEELIDQTLSEVAEKIGVEWAPT